MERLLYIIPLLLTFGLVNVPPDAPPFPAPPASAGYKASLACGDTIIISLDSNCQAIAELGMLILGDTAGCFQPSDLEVFVQDSDPYNRDTIDGPGYFKYLVRATTPKACSDFQVCWGVIRAEDKTGPVITPPKDTTLQVSCVSLDSIFNHAPSLKRTGYPVITDNCSGSLGIKSKFFDYRLDSTDCDTIHLLRVFQAEDQRGNVSTARQIIRLARPGIDSVRMDTVFALDAGCLQNGQLPTDAHGNLHPSVAGYPYFIDQFGDTIRIDREICGLTATYKDSRFNICPLAYKLERTWTVVDWCSDKRRTFRQFIKFGDIEPPVIALPTDTLRISTGPFNCTGDAVLPQLQVREACSNYRILVNLFKDTSRIVPGTGGFVTVPDTQLLYSGPPGIATGLGLGFFRAVYILTDDCKNTAYDTLIVEVRDRVNPVAKCDDLIHISLTVRGFGILKATELDEGSTDNCGLAKLEIRRKTDQCGTQAPVYTPWQKEIVFDCCDQGDTLIAELRATDIFGNTGICWGRVLLEDKLPPVCIAPPDDSLYCDSLPFDFAPGDTAWLRAHFGFARALDNCEASIRETLPEVKIDHCGSGYIRRKFTARDQAGNRSPDTCYQMIRILKRHEYLIRFPKDFTDMCVEPTPDSVLYRELGCDLLAISQDDELFEGAGEVCYKVHRTYRIINWCEYDGISEPVIVPRDIDCDNLPGDEDVWVLVRPNGVVYLDRDDDEKNAVPPANSRGASCAAMQNPDGYWTNSDSLTWLKSRGFWQYTQVIKVNDLVGPEIYYEDTLQFCMDQPDCSAQIFVPFAVFDNCARGDLVEVEVLIKDQIDQFYQFSENPWQVVGRYPKYVMAGLVPQGKYLMEIRADDLCGNVTIVHFYLEVVDCNAPVPPACINGLAGELMPLEPGIDADGDGDEDRGALTVWATDFIASPAFDCSEEIRYSINRAGEIPSPEQTSLTLTCDDPDRVIVEIHAWDNADNPYNINPDGSQGGPNHDYCETYILVQDNMLICDTNAASIAGAIRTETGYPLAGVEVKLNGPGATRVLTDDQGAYFAGGLRRGYDYSLQMKKDGPVTEGVSTFDLVRIGQHILGERTLESPYRMLAADINGSGSITTLDMVLLRKVILNIDAAFPQQRNWLFVPADEVFSGSRVPVHAAANLRNINNLSGNQTNVDFIGVKLGDVTGNAAQAQELSSRGGAEAVKLALEDRQLEARIPYRIPLKIRDLAAFAGLQFTLALSANHAIRFDGFEPGVLSAANVFAEEGADGNWRIHVSWDRTFFSDTQELHTGVLGYLLVTPQRPGTLSQLLKPVLAERGLTPEIYPSGSSLALGLELDLFTVASAADNIGLRVQPNPFARELTVTWEGTSGSSTVIRVFTAQGRKVSEHRLETLDGFNQFLLTDDVFPEAGLYYLTLQTGQSVATRKVVRR